MIKKIFIILGIIGVVIISILAFIVPQDPFVELPTPSAMPLWFSIVLIGNVVYLITLYCIYCKITHQEI